MLYPYPIMTQLNCIDYFIKYTCSLLSSLPIFYGIFCDLFFHKKGHFFRVNLTFKTLSIVEGGPCLRYGFIDGEGFNQVDIKTFIKDLINNFINILIDRAHRVKIDLIRENNFLFNNLFISLRENIFGVFRQLFVEFLYCRSLIEVYVVWIFKKILVYSILSGVQFKVGHSFFHHL